MTLCTNLLLLLVQPEVKHLYYLCPASFSSTPFSSPAHRKYTMKYLQCNSTCQDLFPGNVLPGRGEFQILAAQHWSFVTKE